jgi:cytochrome d ubiquinol oxidase subunit I
MVYLSLIKNKLEKRRWLLRLGVLGLPLGFIAQETGWITAEVGRQPWVIQDLMPDLVAVSRIETSGVMITFFLFLIAFTALLIAEIKIMLSAVSKGFES